MRLRRTSADQPGWTRRRPGRGFTYLDEHGNLLSPEARQRVQDLVIPPAWTDVWITPYENGHLPTRTAASASPPWNVAMCGVLARCWCSPSPASPGVEHRIEVDDPDVIDALQVMRRRRSEDLRLLAPYGAA